MYVLYNLKWNASSNISSGMYIIKVVAPESTFSSIVNLLFVFLKNNKNLDI